MCDHLEVWEAKGPSLTVSEWVLGICGAAHVGLLSFNLCARLCIRLHKSQEEPVARLLGPGESATVISRLTSKANLPWISLRQSHPEAL